MKDPTGHKFTQADGGGGPPIVDDPTALEQLFGNIQNYLNTQNPFLTFAEADVAAVTMNYAPVNRSSVIALAWSPDKQYLAAAGDHPRVCVWHASV